MIKSGTKEKIPEEFLHYAWKYRLFNSAEIFTTSGKKLTIIHPGQQNFNGGPDFLNARLKIDDTLWSGHIEIHVKASDWHRHGHTDDAHYNLVILHAVLIHDQEIYLHVPGDLETMDMSIFLISDQWNKYARWLKSKTWIPCEQNLQGLTDLHFGSWKDRLLVERLESRLLKTAKLHESCNNDWNEVFYRTMAYNYGFGVNSEAMMLLAESLPYLTIARHRHDPFQIEALLFGQAGLLNEVFSDSYPADLQKEYLYLNAKYKLKPLKHSVWNFGRLRPHNFPTIRLAQFSAAFSQTEHLMSAILHTTDPLELRKFFEVEPHPYWKDHFRFDATTKNPTVQFAKKPGKTSTDSILINTVATFLFCYGRFISDQKQMDKAIRLLGHLQPEDNHIIRRWSKLGMKCDNAADSQSLIHLFHVYCTSRRCLDCSLGLKLLNR